MPHCTICGHPQREAIDVHLLDGTLSLRQLAAKFGTSKSSLLRHQSQDHVISSEVEADHLPDRQGEVVDHQADQLESGSVEEEDAVQPEEETDQDEELIEDEPVSPPPEGVSQEEHLRVLNALRQVPPHEIPLFRGLPTWLALVADSGMDEGRLIVWLRSQGWTRLSEIADFDEKNRPMHREIWSPSPKAEYIPYH